VTRRARAASIAFLFLIAGTTACGGSTEDKPTTAPPPVDFRGRTDVRVSAEANVFVPADIVIDRGTTVTWVNNDTIAHNIAKAPTAIDFPDTFGVSVAKFGPGERYSYRFTKAGDLYDYTCTIHTGMNGRVRVVAAAPSTSTTDG
jgi:plastocyanin